MIQRTCDFSDKLSTLPILQQAVGVATILSNSCKLVQDIYRYAIGYNNQMDGKISDIQDYLTPLKSKDEKNIFSQYVVTVAIRDRIDLSCYHKHESCYLRDYKAVIKNEREIFSNYSVLDFPLNAEEIMQGATSDIKVVLEKVKTSGIKTELQSENCIYQKILNYNKKTIGELEREEIWCENDKAKFWHHLHYVGIGILRCIPVISTIYSAVIWRTCKDSGQTPGSVTDNIATRTLGALDPWFRGPLDTK